MKVSNQLTKIMTTLYTNKKAYIGIDGVIFLAFSTEKRYQTVPMLWDIENYEDFTELEW